MKLTLANIAKVIAMANNHPNPEAYAALVTEKAAEVDMEVPAPPPAPVK